MYVQVFAMQQLVWAGLGLPEKAWMTHAARFGVAGAPELGQGPLLRCRKPGLCCVRVAGR